MKNSEKLIKELRQNVKVPEEVWNKYTDCLDTLPQKQFRRKKRPKMLILAAALTIAIAGTAIAAGIVHINKGLARTMHVENETTEALLASGLLSYPADQKEDEAVYSATDNGITITVDTALVDHNSAIIAFKVSGLTMEDSDGRPLGGSPEITIDGEEIELVSGSFYSEWSDSPIRIIDVDGIQRFDYSWSEKLQNTGLNSDGSYTYLVSFLANKDMDSIVGKEIRLHIQDIGYFAPSNSRAKGEDARWPGDWSFNWTIQGSEERIQSTSESTLGDSGAVVTKLEVTPLSVKIVYNWPRIEKTMQTINKDGELEEKNYYLEPPKFAGFKMKDGSILYGRIFVWGLDLGIIKAEQSWLDDNFPNYVGEDIWEELNLLEYVVDLSEIEAALFWKYPLADENAITEASFYQIAVQ